MVFSTLRHEESTQNVGWPKKPGQDGVYLTFLEGSGLPSSFCSVGMAEAAKCCLERKSTVWPRADPLGAPTRLGF